MDVDGFVRDGYVAVRGAVDAATVAACQESIWEGLAGRGVRRDDPLSWPSLAVFHDLGAGPFAAAGMAPALTAAYDELIGPGPRMLGQPAVYCADGFTLDGTDPSLVARAIVEGLATAD